MYRNLAAALILILLMTASVFFIVHINSNNDVEENENHVDSYMKNAVYDQYDNNGQLSLHLSSPLTRHYSVKNYTHFDKPNIIVYQAQQAPWQITSLYGKSLQDNKLIDLWDDVVIYRAAQGDKPETTIRTTVLTINPKEQIAETNQAATIIQPHSVVQSVGFKTDFKSGITQLSSKARVIYEGDNPP